MTPTNLKDSLGNPLFIGNTVEMPEPNSSDNWIYGGFLATIRKVEEVHIIGPSTKPMLLVEDFDGDFFHVEANRVELDQN